MQHLEFVDLPRVKADISKDNRHRFGLQIPFIDRDNYPTLCIVGQNPSDANAGVADKTIQYLEKYVYQNLPAFGSILMLNLYSRIDKYKTATEDLLNAQTDEVFRQSMAEHNDVLMVYGALKTDGAYDFRARAAQLRSTMLQNSISKFSIGSQYAPHPGNPKILYSRLNVSLAKYDFEDLT